MTQKVNCLGWKSAILIVAALRARNRLKPGLRTTLRTVCSVRSPGFSRSEPKMRIAAEKWNRQAWPKPNLPVRQNFASVLLRRADLAADFSTAKVYGVNVSI